MPVGVVATAVGEAGALFALRRLHPAWGGAIFGGEPFNRRDSPFAFLGAGSLWVTFPVAHRSFNRRLPARRRTRSTGDAPAAPGE